MLSNIEDFEEYKQFFEKFKEKNKRQIKNQAREDTLDWPLPPGIIIAQALDNPLSGGPRFITTDIDEDYVKHLFVAEKTEQNRKLLEEAQRETAEKAEITNAANHYYETGGIRSLRHLVKYYQENNYPTHAIVAKNVLRDKQKKLKVVKKIQDSYKRFKEHKNALQYQLEQQRIQKELKEKLNAEHAELERQRIQQEHYNNGIVHSSGMNASALRQWLTDYQSNAEPDYVRGVMHNLAQREIEEKERERQAERMRQVEEQQPTQRLEERSVSGLDKILNRIEAENLDYQPIEERKEQEDLSRIREHAAKQSQEQSDFLKALELQQIEDMAARESTYPSKAMARRGYEKEQPEAIEQHAMNNTDQERRDFIRNQKLDIDRLLEQSEPVVNNLSSEFNLKTLEEILELEAKNRKEERERKYLENLQKIKDVPNEEIAIPSEYQVNLPEEGKHFHEYVKNMSEPSLEERQLIDEKLKETGLKDYKHFLKLPPEQIAEIEKQKQQRLARLVNKQAETVPIDYGSEIMLTRPNEEQNTITTNREHNTKERAANIPARNTNNLPTFNKIPESQLPTARPTPEFFSIMEEIRKIPGAVKEHGGGERTERIRLKKLEKAYASMTPEMQHALMDAIIAKKNEVIDPETGNKNKIISNFLSRINPTDEEMRSSYLDDCLIYGSSSDSGFGNIPAETAPTLPPLAGLGQHYKDIVESNKKSNDKTKSLSEGFKKVYGESLESDRRNKRRKQMIKDMEIFTNPDYFGKIRSYQLPEFIREEQEQFSGD